MTSLSFVRTVSVLFYLLSRVNALQFVTLERFQTLDNYTCTGSSLLSNNALIYRTVMDCIKTCLTYATCHGVFYATSRRTCQVCTENVRLGIDSPNIVDANMSTQCYLREKASTHGAICSSTMTCDVNQYCSATGICTCDPGLSFFPTEDICNTGCPVYGSTYEEHARKYIAGHNIASYTGMSLQDCQDRCTADGQCRTIDYQPGASGCWLQSATALTVPEDFFDATDSYYLDHYNRNCD